MAERAEDMKFELERLKPPFTQKNNIKKSEGSSLFSEIYAVSNLTTVELEDRP